MSSSFVRSEQFELLLCEIFEYLGYVVERQPVLKSTSAQRLRPDMIIRKDADAFIVEAKMYRSIDTSYSQLHAAINQVRNYMTYSDVKRGMLAVSR